MPKRLLLIFALILLPIGATADTFTSPDAPTGLGPQSTSANAGGSSADASALQPAGLSVLQSTTSDSTGLTAPSSTLQAPSTTSDALKVLAAESDGPPQSTSGDTAAFPGGALLISVIVGLIAAAGVVILRDRHRFTSARQEKP